MTEAQLLERVRELRLEGWSPKAIARSLGVPPAKVSPLVRKIAQEPSLSDGLPSLVGCWVNPDWSTGLSVEGFADWPGLDDYQLGRGGLASVLVAREHRYGRVSVCGYLVDVWCLGVKDALGPKLMNDAALSGFVTAYFGGHESAPVEAPIGLAQHLVFGAIEFARHYGFEPSRDFSPAAGHLGAFEGPSAISFGQDGMPYFIEGPYDDGGRVIRTLQRTAGEGNFHFIAELR